MSQEVSTGRFRLFILQAERFWTCTVGVSEEDDRTLQACTEGVELIKKEFVSGGSGLVLLMSRPALVRINIHSIIIMDRNGARRMHLK